MIPITIVTGFLGSGKTTLILNLIPQLPKGYKLALLKNEFGDLAIDSKLAAAVSISGVRELLNGCICCNLVGQLGDALDALRTDVKPDRILIETSGSAFPATLAMEVNRLGREFGHYILDGVISVVDVENWKGYDDTSYTAKMQAKYTDLIVLNKWELAGERRLEDCLDRIGDLEIQVATIKSDKGRVEQSLLLGLDSALAGRTVDKTISVINGHDHADDHQSEVEVISVVLSAQDGDPTGLDMDTFLAFLKSAPKDEIYRVKAVLRTTLVPTSSDGSKTNVPKTKNSENETSLQAYILNWAFGRWSFTLANDEGIFSSETSKGSGNSVENVVLRMTIVTGRYESGKWMKKLRTEELIKMKNSEHAHHLGVERVG